MVVIISHSEVGQVSVHGVLVNTTDQLVLWEDILDDPLLQRSARSQKESVWQLRLKNWKTITLGKSSHYHLMGEPFVVSAFSQLNTIY